MAVDTDNYWQVRRDEQEVATTELDARAIDRRTKSAIYAQLLNIHTAIPGIIDSFDSEKQTATVQPAIKMLYAPDPNAGAGDAQWLNRPLCLDVPVIFPGCGDYVMTFPVNRGDECLLVFCERCIDHWFSEGDVQEQAELRNHDASDAVAIMGLRSQPNSIDDFDEDRLQLRSADGETVISVDDGGEITVDVSGTTMLVEDGKVTVTADSITLDGDTEVTGTLKVGGAVTGSSTAKFIGDVTGATKSLQHHTHSGVQTGGGTSGPPV